MSNLDNYIYESNAFATIEKSNQDMYSKMDDVQNKVNEIKNSSVTLTEHKRFKEELDTKVSMDEFNEQMKDKASKTSVSTALHRKANKNDIELALSNKVDLDFFESAINKV